MDLGVSLRDYMCMDLSVALRKGHGSAVHVVSMIDAMRSCGAQVVPVGAAELLGADGNGRSRGLLDAIPRGQGYIRVLRRLLAERPTISGRLRQALAQHRPDVVYERTSLFFDLAGGVVRDAGIPLVLEVNAPLAQEAGRFRGERVLPLAALQERRAWRLARRVTAVSHDLVARVRAVGQKNVLHVPNAVDHDSFHPGVAPAPEVVSRTAGTFAVAFSGTLKPWHDLPTLLEAMSLVRCTIPCTLVIVGDGPGRPGVERRAAALGVPLVMTGAVRHRRVPELTAAADVCVAPMHPDPRLHYFSPLKAMEYLALGKPTVAADAGDLSDLIRAGAAIGYRPGSSDDLAAALLRLAQDPDLACQTSARGRELAARHSWQRAAERSLRGLIPLGEPGGP